MTSSQEGWLMYRVGILWTCLDYSSWMDCSIFLWIHRTEIWLSFQLEELYVSWFEAGLTLLAFLKISRWKLKLRERYYGLQFTFTWASWWNKPWECATLTWFLYMLFFSFLVILFANSQHFSDEIWTIYGFGWWGN